MVVATLYGEVLDQAASEVGNKIEPGHHRIRLAEETS